ncbi:unnamed protein product [Rotaria magnacalcarata]|uniref:FYVE-type domain-containing protein n=1 Tax=Rotaria magnacalcarata TaxID=392030 RepID=A0A819KI48_9BILA|nr:unnamed protein product [Rotaria magnacalcarata]
MLQTISDTREGFLCPQCHQDMGNLEMLQVHFQNVHMKQSSTVVKGISLLFEFVSSTMSNAEQVNKLSIGLNSKYFLGLFSFAKQKLKSVQNNFQNSNEPSKIYSQYFSFDLHDYHSKKQYMGFTRSHYTYFQIVRKDKLHEIYTKTQQLLLRLELLTNINEQIPPNGNTKERRKYEQGIIPWMEDSVVSICSSCSASFGFSRRKHHCRLDGLVICNQCSRFILFSIARRIVDSNTSSTNNSFTIQQLMNLKTITSSTIINNASNEDHLRICMSCARCLQNYYRQIFFKNIPKDEIFHYYENIIQAKKEYTQVQLTYVAIIDSILSGNTKYQIKDAQQVYRQLSVSYEKIDSTSKKLVAFADKCPNIDENDISSKARYATLCRNIRMYAVQVLQNFSLSTRRVPTEDEIKQARDAKQRSDNELMEKVILSIPGINGKTLELSEELKPFIQQYYQVVQYMQQAKLAGRDDEVKLLESNLEELAQAMRVVHQN